MNKYPRIRFTVNKKAEKETALFFISEYSKDNNFFENFIKDYPDLEKIKGLNKKEAIKFLNEKIDYYYKLKDKELKERKKEIEKNWNNIKDKFFVESKRIFGHKWPRGLYTANISLFGMFRLIPGTKKFSIPSKDYAGNPASYGHINYTIAHEMMHILFEDFYKKNFKKKLEKMKYFDFMEIVNCIVLNLPEIKNITKWVTYPYPQHKKYYEKLNNLYKKCSSMKEFCEKANNL